MVNLGVLRWVMMPYAFVHLLLLIGMGGGMNGLIMVSVCFVSLQ